MTLAKERKRLVTRKKLINLSELCKIVKCNITQYALDNHMTGYILHEFTQNCNSFLHAEYNIVQYDWEDCPTVSHINTKQVQKFIWQMCNIHTHVASKRHVEDLYRELLAIRRERCSRRFFADYTYKKVRDAWAKRLWAKQSPLLDRYGLVRVATYGELGYANAVKIYRHKRTDGTVTIKYER